MALIKMGAAVQDIRGSLNGSTYSRNKGGAYIRTKVSPVQPRTPAQLAQRAIFSNNAKAWSGSLTDSQRQAWTSFAAANPLTNVFGDAITISGLAAYQQLNAVLGTIGKAPISDPPASKAVTPLAAVTELVADISTPEITLSTDPQTTVAGSQYYIFATALLSPGTTPGQSAFRFIGAYVSTAAAADIDVTGNWMNKFGDMTAGKRISILVANVNVTTGAVTIGQKFTSLVAA